MLGVSNLTESVIPLTDTSVEKSGLSKRGAADDAAAQGDGDASCVLARCMCGSQYVWSGHGFRADDKRTVKLLHKSVEQGCAIGVLTALRTGAAVQKNACLLPYSCRISVQAPECSLLPRIPSKSIPAETGSAESILPC